MKKMIVIIVMVFISCGAYECVQAEDPIKFHLPVFPPYVFEKDNKIQGIGVELVDKIMKEAGIQYSLNLVSNYGRVVFDVKNGDADGFFLASQNAERDGIAVFSNAVVLNRWCWFYPVGGKLNPNHETFKSEARVGTYLNSNTHKWLLKNGYQVTGSPSQIDSLVKMLEVDRINVIFLAEAVFLDALTRVGEKPERYIKVIQEEKPFGIYLSKKYLSKNQGVMEKINTAIDKVIPKGE